MQTAINKQGAHNLPCAGCKEINWQQRKNCQYPIWDCQTKACEGSLWSD